MSTPVVATSMAMYTQGSCWSWEPPEVSVSTPPANGRVTHGLVKSAIVQPGGQCDGKVIDYRVSLYTPNPGFRGQDRLTLQYEGIRNDGGGRWSAGQDVIIDVKSLQGDGPLRRGRCS